MSDGASDKRLTPRAEAAAWRVLAAAPQNSWAGLWGGEEGDKGAKGRKRIPRAIQSHTGS